MYDHYITVDWAQSNMAIARMTTQSNNIKTIDTKADVSDLRAFLFEQIQLKTKGLLSKRFSPIWDWIQKSRSPILPELPLKRMISDFHEFSFASDVESISPVMNSLIQKFTFLAAKIP